MPRSLVLSVLSLLVGVGIAVTLNAADATGARNAGHRQALLRIARDIAALQGYPQLSRFRVAQHFLRAQLQIQYAFHTHRARHRGGWTSGVPNPDADGIWFYIDVHAPSSRAQIHTQPITQRLCLGKQRVQFLILEGARTKRVSAQIRQLLTRHGVRPCR